MEKFVFTDGKTVYLEQVMEYLNQHHPDLHPQEKYLLLDLVRRKKFGQYFASFAQLGKAIGCSKNSAENLAKKLRKAGLLTWKSGSVKGNRRLANEYSFEKLLVELERFHQEKIIKDGERCHPNIREGNPNFYEGVHPKNCTGMEGNRHRTCEGPSQNLGSDNNIIKRNINNITVKELGERKVKCPQRFYDFEELLRWVRSRPAVNAISEACLKNFYYKMHDKNWLANDQPIRNMEQYLLAWSSRHTPANSPREEEYETPGDSFRYDDDLRRRMIARFGSCPSE